MTSDSLGPWIGAAAIVLAAALTYLGVRYTASKAAQTSARTLENERLASSERVSADRDANAVLGFDKLTERLSEQLAKQDDRITALGVEVAKVHRLFDAALAFINVLVSQWPAGKVLPAVPDELSQLVVVMRRPSPTESETP